MPPKEPENVQLKWTLNDQVASNFTLIEMFFFTHSIKHDNLIN